METVLRWLDTRNKPGLLWAFLERFQGGGVASFEGELQQLGILELPGASYDETALLKRQTRSPRQDFVVLSICAETIVSLKPRLNAPGVFNRAGALCHVQIAYRGQLVFGAYDNFHRECVVAYEPVPLSFLDELVATGVLRSYQLAKQ